jgi:ABC-2 type transport system ATP-binding protein
MLMLKGLTKTYANGIRAMQDISLDIDRGIFGLLGPNGAGKSTLMRTLATLQEPDAGSVELNGVDLLQAPHTARRMLGYLPQDFGVYPQVSAQELLEQLAIFKGFVKRQQRREMVAEQLHLVNLYEQRQQKLGTFSGGMRQRFGIAQALLGSPQLIIVDEPTAGLDPAERIRFQNLLADIGQDRVLLLSTHIVEDVAELCPQMAILNRGQLVCVGSPASLIGQLHGKVWSKNLAPGETPHQPPGTTLITSRIAQGTRSLRVFSETPPQGRFTAVVPDLHDVYFTALQQQSTRTTEVPS